MSYFLKGFVKKPRPVLLCPGPVLLSKQVMNAVRNTNIGHREAEFSELLVESINMLKPIVGIGSKDNSYKIAFITGSGTAANETVISSIGTIGPILVISNGEFGKRLFDVAKLHNKDVDQLKFKWQERIDLEKVVKALKLKQYRLVAVVHHETSSGMLNPIAAIAKLAHKYGALISVDAISSIGAEIISIKKWGIDILVGASGKALSAMPGVGILVVKNSVLKLLNSKSTRGHYLDMHKHFLFMNDYVQTPNTPAVHVFVSLHASLKEITQQGRVQFRQTIRSRAVFVRSKLTRMGMEYANYNGNNSNVITCVTLPAYISFKQLAHQLKLEGIVVYNGKGVLKNKIFQVGHIGALLKNDTRNALYQLQKIIRQFMPAMHASSQSISKIRTDNVIS